MKEKIVISLGSNSGDREQNIMSAISNLISKGFVPEKISSLYETEPVGFKDQNDFINAVITGHFKGDPEKLLSTIKKVETDMGRVKSFRNGPRNIDIDIILYGDRKVFKKELTIPHKSYRERKFVLEPLNEIEKDIADPETGKKISKMVSECRDVSYIKKFGKIHEIQS